MSQETFERLANSIRQAGKITRGEDKEARKFTIEIDDQLKSNLSSYKIWAVCVSNEDDSLIPRKIYEVEIYPQLPNVRVIDEDGEAFLCPKEWFLPISVPQILSKTLAEFA